MNRRTPEFFLGRTAGSYRLQNVLGSGGFATTFLGYKEGNSTPYAVKVFDQSSGIAEVTAFLQEAFVLAQLKNPNIVPVYQVGALPVELQDERKQKFTEHYPYFVMKYANQGDVRRLKPKQSPLPLSPEKVLDILSQAAN